MRATFPKVLIELGSSKIDGVGVFAVAPLNETQRLAAGISEADYRRLIPWKHFEEYDADVQHKIRAFCIGTPIGFIPPDKLDFNRLSVEWFLNHSCDGNVGFNDDGDFVSRRIIEKGEELTYDYALAESNPDFRMECKCGSVNCRHLVTGNDWKDPDFHAKNLAFMLPRLRRSLDEVGRTERTYRVATRRR